MFAAALSFRVTESLFGRQSLIMEGNMAESSSSSVASKKVPIRRRKIAEDYARKVRVEAPKQTRQEDPRGGPAAGAHDHGPAQKNKNKKP